MKKILSAIVLVIGLLGNSNAQASDASSALQSAQIILETATKAAAEKMAQVQEWVQNTAWVQQAKDMMETIRLANETVDKMMGMLDELKNIDKALLRMVAVPGKGVDYNYAPLIPSEYLDGVGYKGKESKKSSTEMRNALKIDPEKVGVMPMSIGSALTSLGVSVPGVSGVLSVGKKTIKQISEEASEENAQEIAVINAMANEAFTQASNRVAKIKVLEGSLRPASEGGIGPEADKSTLKYVADIQALIQVEQAQLTNDQNKLAALAVLQQSQRDMYEQRKKEIAKYSTSGDRKDTFEQKAIHVGVLAVTKGAYSLMEDAYDAD